MVKYIILISNVIWIDFANHKDKAYGSYSQFLIIICSKLELSPIIVYTVNEEFMGIASKGMFFLDIYMTFLSYIRVYFIIETFIAKGSGFSNIILRKAPNNNINTYSGVIYVKSISYY